MRRLPLLLTVLLIFVFASPLTALASTGAGYRPASMSDPGGGTECNQHDDCHLSWYVFQDGITWECDGDWWQGNWYGWGCFQV